MHDINIYKKPVLAAICALLLCSFFQKRKLPDGVYMAMNIAGEKSVTGLSYKQSSELLGKWLLRVKRDSLFYQGDTLLIKEVEQGKLNKDSILNAINFLKIPLFLKSSDVVYYYELFFTEKSSLTRLEIFYYGNKFFFEHEGYYYELKKTK